LSASETRERGYRVNRGRGFCQSTPKPRVNVLGGSMGATLLSVSRAGPTWGPIFIPSGPSRRHATTHACWF